MTSETLMYPGRLTCGCIETDDPVVFETTSQPWEVFSEPLSTHSFLNRKHYIATESVLLYREHFSAPTRLRGLSPPGRLVMAVPYQHGELTRYGGGEPQHQVMPISYPGVLDAVVDGGDTHFMVLIDLHFLQRKLGEEGMAALDEAAQRGGLAVDPRKFLAFSSWLNAIITTAGPRDRRRHLASTPLIKPIRKARLSAEKAERLLKLLEHDIPRHLLELCRSSNQTQPRLRGSSSRSRVVNQALEHLRESGPSMPSVGDLCRITGAKQRTLEYAFEERFGLSPLRFIRVQRLHHARRQLAAAEPGSIKVAQVAHNLGFRHLSRFAQEYRGLFGELPSRTLERRIPAFHAAPLMDAKPIIMTGPRLNGRRPMATAA